MQTENEDLINVQIKENYDAIDNLRKLIPVGIIVMTAFSFIYPVVPGRRSNQSWADWLGYPNAVIACLILSGLVYFIGYKIAVKRRIKNIKELKTK